MILATRAVAAVLLATAALDYPATASACAEVNA